MNVALVTCLHPPQEDFDAVPLQEALAARGHRAAVCAFQARRFSAMAGSEVSASSASILPSGASLLVGRSRLALFLLLELRDLGEHLGRLVDERLVGGGALRDHLLEVRARRGEALLVGGADARVELVGAAVAGVLLLQHDTPDRVATKPREHAGVAANWRILITAPILINFLFFTILAFVSLGPIVLMTHLPPLPLAAAVAVSVVFFMFVPGRFGPAMALVTGSVAPRLRGSFLSFNGAVQQLGAGMASFASGLIVGRDQAGALTGFDWAGWCSVAATLVAVALALSIRVVPDGSGGPE